MSSISSLSGGASGLYSFIQSLTGTNQSSATSAASSTDPTQSSSTGQAVTGAGGHHHHHGGGGAMKQIQDAVTNALQTAQSSGSSTDPNQIIEDAIAKVLQNNNSATSSNGAQGAADPDGDGDAPGGATGSNNAQSFQQLLQSVGVSPQQFHQDFLAAVKDAQGGQMNPLTALQSFPVGSTVDMIG